MNKNKKLENNKQTPEKSEIKRATYKVKKSIGVIGKSKSSPALSQQNIRKAKTNANLPKTVCNIDSLSVNDLYESLREIKRHPIEPFTFLRNVVDEKPVKPSAIDEKFAALRRRIESNRNLLERTNRYIKNVNFLSHYKKGRNSGEEDKVVDSNSPAFDVEYPEFDNFQSTIETTLQILDNIKRLSSGEISFEEISTEFEGCTSREIV